MSSSSDGSRPFVAGLHQRFKSFGNLDIMEDLGPMPLITLVVGIAVTLNILLIGFFLIAHSEVMSGGIALGIAVVAAVSTVVYLVTGSSATMARAQIGAGIVGVIGIHIALGGYSWSGGWLAWGLSHVTIVALFFSRRAATLVLSIYMVAALAFVGLESRLQDLRQSPPDVSVPAVLAGDTMVVNLALLAVLATLLVGLIGREQRRNTDLLRNVLPSAIASRLKEAPGVIADRFDECSVLFADLVGFTSHAAEVSPDRLVDELNQVFTRFDDLVSRLSVEKIKTIGDGYMAVAGVPSRVEGHAGLMCDLGLGMQTEMDHLNQELGTNLSLRVGITTGQVVAGVIGRSRFSYDLWGDTVNVASRLEKLATPGTVLVSEEVVTQAGGEFQFEARGTIEVRGKGPLPVHMLVSRRTAPSSTA